MYLVLVELPANHLIFDEVPPKSISIDPIHLLQQGTVLKVTSVRLMRPQLWPPVLIDHSKQRQADDFVELVEIQPLKL